MLYRVVIPPAISAGTQSVSTGTVVYSNSNNVTFGMTNSSIVTASASFAQTNQSAIRALGVSNTGVTAGNTGVSTGIDWVLAGSQSLTLSQSTAGGGPNTIWFQHPAWLTTTPAQLSVGNSNLGNTAGDTGVFTGRVVLVGSDNITLSGSSNGGSATVSIIGAAGVGGLTNIRVSAGTTSNLLSAITFADGGGVSFGINASTLTATVATSLTNMRVSAGTTSNLLSALTFANGNGITFGLDASTLTASHNGLTSQSNQNVTAGNGGFAFQTLSFSDANGVSFGTSAGSAITASYTRPVVSNAIQSVGSATGSGTNTSRFAADDHVHAGVFSVGLSNVGNTSGDTRVDVGRFVFAGGNGVTLSQGTAANALNTITVSVATSYRASNDAIGTNTAQTNVTWTVNSAGLSFNAAGYAGTTTAITGGASITLNSGGLRFNGTALAGTGTTFNGANISGSITQNTAGLNLSLSVAAPGAAAEQNAIHLLGANTAGNTTATGSTIGWSGINLTLSGTNASIVNISAPATSSLSATGWASISVNGSTVSIGASTTMNAYAVGNTTGTSSGTVDIRTVSIRGLGGVYVGASNSGFVVSRPILYDYEPFPMNVGGANTAVSNIHSIGAATSGIVYFWPFQVVDYVACGYINLVLSENFTTLGNSSGRQTGGLSYALYTQGIGANSSQLSTYGTSGSIGWSVTGNNSSYTINYPTTTGTAGVTTGATNSAGSNITSQFTGQKLVVLPFGSTLTPGQYWLGVMHTLSTSSINVGLLHSLYGWNMGTTLMNLAPIGGLTSAYSGTYSEYWGGPWAPACGSWTTANNTNLPGSVGVNSITKGAVSGRPVMRLWSNQ